MINFSIIKFYHRGLNCIGVKFDRDDNINQKVRSIQGVRWSQTHRCWYGEESEALARKFEEIFRPATGSDKVGATVEHSVPAVKENLSIPTNSSTIEPFIPDVDLLVALQVFKRQMEVKRYAKNSIINYNKAVMKFLKFHAGRTWNELNEDDISVFQHKVIIEKKLSKAYQNLLINAIKLFYECNTGVRPDSSFMVRPRNSQYLPTILSREDLEKLLKGISNKKHKAMLSLCYACGLRSGELLGIKQNHIDKNRKILMVRNAKGNKDRQLPLSDKIIEMIASYINTYKPINWLFEGQVKGEPYSKRSLQLVLKKALLNSALSKDITLHCLRHTFATHLIESGVHIRMVQELLGHSSIRTTEIYTHVSRSMIERLKNPFDDLDI